MERWQLAARIAESEGYDVYDSDGRRIGQVDHLQYERHADQPDFVVVEERRLLRRRLVRVPFGAVTMIDPEDSFIRLTVTRASLEVPGRNA